MEQRRLASTGTAPTTSERSTILFPANVRLILEVWGYIATLYEVWCRIFGVILRVDLNYRIAMGKVWHLLLDEYYTIIAFHDIYVLNSSSIDWNEYINLHYLRFTSDLKIILHRTDPHLFYNWIIVVVRELQIFSTCLFCLFSPPATTSMNKTLTINIADFNFSADTVWCRYITSLCQNPHTRLPIARPWGRAIGFFCKQKRSTKDK